MIRIDTPEALASHIASFKKQHSHCETNLFLQPEELDRAIRKGRIHVQETEGCLSLYIRLAAGETMYYCYADSPGNIKPDSGARPVYIEVIGKAKAQTQWQAQMEAIAAGLDSSYVQMKTSAAKLILQNTSLLPDGFSIRKSTPADRIPIYDYFRPVQDRTPDPDQLDAYLADAEGWIIEEAGMQAGFLIAKEAMGASSLEYIAIHPQYRRRSLGEALVWRYLSDTCPHVKNYTLWVNQENQGARALYEKFGYTASALEKRIYQLT